MSRDSHVNVCSEKREHVQSTDSIPTFNNVTSLLMNRITELYPEVIWNETNMALSNSKKFDVFQLISCPKCSQLLEKPHTMSCGCTFCKRCNREQNVDKMNCNVCYKERDRRRLSVVDKMNHVLNNTLEKCFKKEMASMKLQFEGCLEQERKHFPKAIEKYDKALELCPENYMTWLNRSDLLSEMNLLDQALEAAKKACVLKPDFEKGYLQKANILLQLGRNIDAVVEVLNCVFINVFNEEAILVLNKVIPCLVTRYSKGMILNNNETEHEKNSATQTRHSVERSDSCEKENADVMETDDVTWTVDMRRMKKGECECPIEAIARKFVNDMKNRNCSEESENRKKLAEKDFCTDDQLQDLSIDLECILCRMVLFEPVTTTCGHVFCKDCLTRWLDHNPGCPVCRFSLFRYINVWKMEVTSLIDELVKIFFQSDVRERSEARDLEHRKLAKVATDTDDDIPIFVCSIALPGQPLQIQIFEPRYRLMLRQCLESGSRQFGMCTYDREHGFAEHGVMIEVNEVFFVPEGRAFLDCSGGRRFKVLSRGVINGYNTAKVKWIKDVTIPSRKLDEVKEMNTKVHSDIQSFLETSCAEGGWLDSISKFPDCGNDQIERRDGPEWIWWLVSAFLDSTELKLIFLSADSLEQRLNLIRRQLELTRLLNV